MYGGGGVDLGRRDSEEGLAYHALLSCGYTLSDGRRNQTSASNISRWYRTDNQLFRLHSDTVAGVPLPWGNIGVGYDTPSSPLTTCACDYGESDVSMPHVQVPGTSTDASSRIII